MPGAHALHREVEPGISSVPFFAHAADLDGTVWLRIGLPVPGPPVLEQHATASLHLQNGLPQSQPQSQYSS